jgi:Site-specific recombinase XerD
MADYIKRNPLEDKPLPPNPKPLPKALSYEEIQRLLNAVEVKEEITLRDRVFLEFMYATGLRISESLKFKGFGHILGEQLRKGYWEGKQGEDRTFLYQGKKSIKRIP